ncbi:MAG: class C beta-lactamase-related serine hydrolase, partial [Brevundimonas sp.]
MTVRVMRILIVAAVAAFALPAIAQSPPPATIPLASVRAMAAGYKALTVCSALKTAEAAGGERTLASVEANELVGVYPEIDAIVREMPVEIYPARVSVAWDDVMPARSAVWRESRGCVIMPVGWTGEQIAPLPPRRPEDRPIPAGEPADATALEPVFTRAASGGFGEGSNTTALLVLRDGRLVSEWYAEGFGPDTPQRTWSVGKSIAGTLIGAAVQRGEADVNAPAAIPDWSREGDPRAAITLDQLMRMSSGLT